MDCKIEESLWRTWRMPMQYEKSLQFIGLKTKQKGDIKQILRKIGQI